MVKPSSKLSTHSIKAVAKNTNEKESSVNKVKQAKVVPVSTNKSKQAKKPMEKEPNKSVKLQKKVLPTKTSIAKKPIEVEKQSVKKNVNTKKVVAVKPEISSKKQQPKIPITTTTKIKHDPIEMLTEEEILFNEFKEYKKDQKELSIKENIARAQKIRMKFATAYVELCDEVPATSTELENLKKCHIGLKLIHQTPEKNYTIYDAFINNMDSTLEKLATLCNTKPYEVFQQIRKVFNEQFDIEIAIDEYTKLVTSVPNIDLKTAHAEYDKSVAEYAIPPLMLKNIHRSETFTKYEEFLKVVSKMKMPDYLKDLHDELVKMTKNWIGYTNDYRRRNFNILSIVLLNIYLLGFYKT